jgi:GDPmannose 4,6-dehydratase
MGKIALISGITGQDGSYLAELLLSKGYEVHGIVRRSSTYPLGNKRIEHLRGKISLHYGDVTDPFSLLWILKKVRPDELYHLAAQSHVQVSWETPLYTAQTTGLGTLNILESIRILDLETKIYQASTSELFDGLSGVYNEESRMNPVSPYGTAKLYAYQIAKNYRDAFGMFVCNGILFNHESFRRGDNFVTKKIALDSEKGETHLGNTDASRDWGYAPEYVEGMWRMLQQENPDDYVLATGETHTIKEFVEWVKEATGKELKVIHDSEYERPVDVPVLCGDASKAKRILGWEATIKGKEIAKKVLTNDYAM